jgi:hypothetical protein
MKVQSKRNTTLAPIAIFAYNRPRHLEVLLQSLANNPEALESKVYIFIDGPRSERDQASVMATRLVASQNFSFGEVTISVSRTNLGLGNSIRGGVTKVFQNHSKVIVLEDDLRVSGSFLNYMNSALHQYEKVYDVASIQGFTYQFQNPLPSPYFLRGADCLGWGSWKDRWESITWNPEELLRRISGAGLTKQFNLDGAHSYSSALRNEVKNGFHSWAIYWHASMFLQNRLSLFPERSLVEYRGADGSGTHQVIFPEFWSTSISTASEWDFPLKIGESSDARREFINYHRLFFPKLPLPARILRKLSFLLKVISGT